MAQPEAFHLIIFTVGVAFDGRRVVGQGQVVGANGGAVGRQPADQPVQLRFAVRLGRARTQSLSLCPAR